MWKDVFTSSPPKPCHSARVSTASAQLTKSISLRVCERVVRSVWGGSECICVCAGDRVVPKAGRPFPSHQLLRRQDTLRAPGGGHRSGDRDYNGLSGASTSLTPSTHTHVHTHTFQRRLNTQSSYCAYFWPMFNILNPFYTEILTALCVELNRF